METLLLSNLQANQAFDSALKSGSAIDRMAAKFLNSAMFTPDENKRTKAIDQLQGEIVTYFKSQVQPEARRLGTINARAIVDALPASDRKAGLSDAAVREKILIEGANRPTQRIEIVRALINDKANTLENRLSAYWLEPGANDKAKLDRLIEIHRGMNEAQVKYNTALSSWLAGGQAGAKPRKPNLDFMAKFQSEAKGDLRTQARRAGTDAETAVFVKRGHTILAWVTVNASEACPDCQKRNGMKGDIAFWESFGKPGAGKTFCGANCFCMLVPAETITANPQLAEKGISTSKGEGEVKPKPANPPAVKPTPTAAKPPAATKPPPKVAKPVAKPSAFDRPEMKVYGQLARLQPTGGRNADELIQDFQDAHGLAKKSPAAQEMTTALYASRHRTILTDQRGTPIAAASLDLDTPGISRVKHWGWTDGIPKVEVELISRLAKDANDSGRALVIENYKIEQTDALKKMGAKIQTTTYLTPATLQAADQEAILKKIGRPVSTTLWRPYREVIPDKLTPAAYPAGEKKRQAVISLASKYPTDQDRISKADEIRAAVVKLIAPAPGDRYPFKGNTQSIKDQTMRESAKEGEEYVASVLGKKDGGKSALGRFKWKDLGPAGRAYHSKRLGLGFEEVNTMALSTRKDVSTVVHEWGHEIEASVGGAEKAAQAFRAYRVGNQPLVKMSSVAPGQGYADSERGADDDFGKTFTIQGHAHYVGKDCGPHSSEITSMGIQMLHRDPIMFASKDPEYFRYILGILDGHALP